MIDEKMKELIAVGASVSCNCHPCVKFHVDKAGKLGIEPEDIKEAIKVGVMVRSGAAGQMDKLLSESAEKMGVDIGDNSSGKQCCG